MWCRRALYVAVCLSAAWQGTASSLPLQGNLTLSSYVVRAGDSLWAHCAVQLCPRSDCVNPHVYIRLDGVRLWPSQPVNSTTEFTASETTNGIGNTDSTQSSASKLSASTTQVGTTATAATAAPDGQSAGAGTGCDVVSTNVTAASVQPRPCFVQCMVRCDLHGSIILNEIKVAVGHFPDAPSELQCEVRGGEMGSLVCSWQLRRDSLLTNSSHFCYQAVNNDDIKICEDVEGAQTINLPSSKLDFQKHWRFWVEVQNALGQSRSPTLSLVPMERVTINAPTLKVTTYARIPDQVTVTWKDTPGLSIKYTCDLQLVHGDETPLKTVSNRKLQTQLWEFHNLTPDTAYCVRIRCSQPVPRAPKGTWGRMECFSTPPAYPMVGPEVWRILGPGSSGRVLNLTLLWKPLNAKEAISYTVNGTADGKNFTRVVLRELEPQKVHALQLGEVPVPSEWCVQASNLAGPSTGSCLRLSDKALPAPAHVDARGVGDGVVAVSWSPAGPRSHAMEGYVVEWVGCDDGATTLSRHWLRVPANTSHVALSEHMKPYTCYNISVVANYGNGDGTSGIVQAYAQQGVPNVGPKVSIVNITSSSVNVYWTQIPSKERRGFTTGHVIFWGQGHNANHRIPIRGSDCFYKVGNLSANEEYSVMVAAVTEAGEGPPGPKTHFKTQAVVGPMEPRNAIGETRKEEQKRLRCASSMDLLLALSSGRKIPPSAAVIEEVDKMLGLWSQMNIGQPDDDSRYLSTLPGRNKGCLSGSMPLPPRARQCVTVEGRVVSHHAARLLRWQQRWLGARCSRQCPSGNFTHGKREENPDYNQTYKDESPENQNPGLNVTVGTALVAFTLICFAIYQIPCIRKTLWPPVPDPGKSLLWKLLNESKGKDWAAVFPHLKNSYAPHPDDDVALCRLDADPPGQSGSGPEAHDAHLSYLPLDSATPGTSSSHRYVNTCRPLCPAARGGEWSEATRYQNTLSPLLILTPVPSRGIGDV